MISLTSRLNKLSLSFHRFSPVSSHCISSSSSSRKLTLEQQLGLPPKPKRPISAFLRFSQLVRVDLLKDNPNMKVTEVTKIASVKWKAADESLKRKLTDEYQREMEQFRVRMDGYMEELSKVDKDKLRQLQVDPRTKGEKQAMRKQRSSLGCPKKPMSSFLIFLQKRKEETQNPPANHKEFVAKVSDEWKNLDPSEKAKYQEMQATQKAAYEKEMAEWERQMRETGNAHLLSPKKAPAKRPKSL